MTLPQALLASAAVGFATARATLQVLIWRRRTDGLGRSVCWACRRAFSAAPPDEDKTPKDRPG